MPPDLASPTTSRSTAEVNASFEAPLIVNLEVKAQEYHFKTSGARKLSGEYSPKHFLIRNPTFHLSYQYTILLRDI